MWYEFFLVTVCLIPRRDGRRQYNVYIFFLDIVQRVVALITPSLEERIRHDLSLMIRIHLTSYGIGTSSCNGTQGDETGNDYGRDNSCSQTSNEGS